MINLGTLFHNKFITDHLILRKWLYSDIMDLYQYAKEEIIGKMSGWIPHSSIYYSEQVFRYTYQDRNHFAIALKDDNKLIGSISLIPGSLNNKKKSKNEAEIGYWIGKPFWNKGYATEATLKMLDYGFMKKNYSKIWGGSLHINNASIKVLQKCGFKYAYSKIDTFLPDLSIPQQEDVFLIERQQWLSLNEKVKQKNFQ